jgi:hypothetical protein
MRLFVIYIVAKNFYKEIGIYRSIWVVYSLGGPMRIKRPPCLYTNDYKCANTHTRMGRDCALPAIPNSLTIVQNVLNKVHQFPKVDSTVLPIQGASVYI